MHSVQFSSVSQSCLTLCDSMDYSTPGLPVHHQLPESCQTQVHWVSDAIQPFHPLSSPSPPALNLSQHQGLFKWVSFSHQVAKVLSLNKSISYLSLCILLNSFCDRTQRTWALLISETRYVILIKKQFVQAPVCVLTGFESQPIDLSPSLGCAVSLTTPLMSFGCIRAGWDYPVFPGSSCCGVESRIKIPQVSGAWRS